MLRPGLVLVAQEARLSRAKRVSRGGKQDAQSAASRLSRMLVVRRILRWVVHAIIHSQSVRASYVS